MCSYKATDKLTKMLDDRSSSLVVYSQQELGSVVERAAGGLAQTHFLHDHENNADPMFPEEGDENKQEHEAPGYSNGVSQSAKKKPTEKKGDPTKKRYVGRGTGGPRRDHVSHQVNMFDELDEQCALAHRFSFASQAMM